jgi:hypothetical protein
MLGQRLGPVPRYGTAILEITFHTFTFRAAPRMPTMSGRRIAARSTMIITGSVQNAIITSIITVTRHMATTRAIGTS